MSTKAAVKPTQSSKSMPFEVRADKVIPKGRLDALAFWQYLDKDQQERICEALVDIRLVESSVQKGKHLIEIRNMLAHLEGAFKITLESLEDVLQFSCRTGYRYAKDYETLLAFVHAPVTDAMMQNGTILEKASRERPLGDHQEAYQALKAQGVHPPKDGDQAEALRYVRQLEIQHERMNITAKDIGLVKNRAAQAGNKSIERSRFNELFMTRRVFKLIKSAQANLPNEAKDRFLENVVGYALTVAGKSEQTFYPLPVPSLVNRRAGAPTGPRNKDAKDVNARMTQ
jgi:hypothetical protein